jgi:putative transposase
MVYGKPRGDYVHYYNNERIKLGLQGLSPVAYRLKNTA